ncbi:Uncharacterized conserved protein YbaR, Trm112 family [Ferrithrix thermotolerans DSM 19514]|jgi:uncharacterized protein YbaR (Trm112 family)|uniref:UPF0434 protein SAMN02745225_00130 n=1 Tax=Ferrithrix thermotolerans DSM 19514 TaxID=1121881 RepID=A0A1M4S790_9ACTN|nr:Trm112 family protein [Ferrithrix thermotolerans]SHE27897.1 Uncharacterized conserved protein YbaR, Trm112 family [Ferrithrix thermotolerans DSM 19514]
MALSKGLLDILVCPLDKGELWYIKDGDFLYNPRLRRKYKVIDDIPVMLVEESELVGEDEHEKIVKSRL